jgi:hypothetical protein
VRRGQGDPNRSLARNSDYTYRAIKVAPDLSVPGVSNIFAIGDVAVVDNHGGKPLPLVAPVAKQEGAYVARVIRSRLDGKAPPSAFGYRDPGSLAIIGRSAAAVDFGFVPDHRFCRLAGVGICPHFLLDRFPEQNCRILRVGLGMADLCSRRPADHRTSWSASRRRSAAITILSCRLLSGSRTTEIVIAGVRGNSRPSRRDWSATQAAGIAVKLSCAA